MAATEDQYRGALVGLAMGDALGAPHEGGPLERLLWRMIGSTSTGLRRFTDDTQMALDLARSLLDRGELDQDDLATRFSQGYRWDRGYGPGAARILKHIRAGRAWREASRSVYPEGSFGNGGAMRSPVVGVFFHTRPDELLVSARLAAEVTHAHPLGVEGALLIALATSSALGGLDGLAVLDCASRACGSAVYSDRIDKARTWLETNSAVPARRVRAELGMGITAPTSCVTALYLAARFLAHPFEALLTFAAEAGGDVDTVGAMAGGIWGAANGLSKLPEHLVHQVEDATLISDTAGQIYAHSQATLPGPG